MEPAEIQKQLAIGQHSRQADQFADRYRQLTLSAYDSCFAYSRHRLGLLLERYLPQDGRGLRLLDLGCGTGHHMAALSDRGFDVAGVDGSEEMLEHARVNNPEAEINLADVDSIPFGSSSFDFVLCIEVFRYLPDFVDCVREIGRVLKPGGICLATAAPRLNLNGYWLVNRLAAAVPVGNLVHLRQFFTTSRALRRCFAAAGFERPNIHGVYLGPVNWIERLTPSLLPATLRKWERIDSSLADTTLLREFSNMFLVRAVRRG